MPAAIADNKFASHRIPAWHGLGVVFEENITDFLVMLETAGMLNLSIESIPATLGDAEFLKPTNHIVWTKDDGTKVVLGTVGKNYDIITLESSFAFLQNLHDGASWETAGLINGGAVAFGSIAYDHEIVLDPEGVADVVKTYILMSTSFDGSKSLVAGMTPVRVVCANTLGIALSGGLKSQIKIRHTRNHGDRMAEQTALWRGANQYFDAFEAEAKALYSQSVNDKQFNDIIAAAFPKPDKDASKIAVTKYDNLVGKNTQAWKMEANAGIRGTGWGAFNALTEANQWFRNVRQGEKGAESFYAAGAGFDDVTNRFRQNALAVVKAFA